MTSIRKELLDLCFSEEYANDDDSQFLFLCIIDAAKKAVKNFDDMEIIKDSIVEIQSLVDSIRVNNE